MLSLYKNKTGKGLKYDPNIYIHKLFSYNFNQMKN